MEKKFWCCTFWYWWRAIWKSLLSCQWYLSNMFQVCERNKRTDNQKCIQSGRKVHERMSKVCLVFYSRFSSGLQVGDWVKMCIILHNMIVSDRVMGSSPDKTYRLCQPIVDLKRENVEQPEKYRAPQQRRWSCFKPNQPGWSNMKPRTLQTYFATPKSINSYLKHSCL